jgi:hypothetical protein
LAVADNALSTLNGQLNDVAAETAQNKTQWETEWETEKNLLDNENDELNNQISELRNEIKKIKEADEAEQNAIPVPLEFTAEEFTSQISLCNNTTDLIDFYDQYRQKYIQMEVVVSVISNFDSRRIALAVKMPDLENYDFGYGLNTYSLIYYFYISEIPLKRLPKVGDSIKISGILMDMHLYSTEKKIELIFAFSTILEINDNNDNEG